MPPSPVVSPREAASLLLLEEESEKRCATRKERDARVRCLLAERHSGKMLEEAQNFYTTTGGVLGLLEAGNLDGGYRGVIKVVPQIPEGKYAKHLGWVLGGLGEIDTFFTWLGAPRSYRWKPLGLRFFRSVNKHTPAAFAADWQVAYNVEGGINTSADVVRETLFHEVFHLNDAEHGGWSERVLQPIYAQIIARCGARTPCLTPYAPGTTMVRGGTYYAFQPGNGVGEYAAELALRYYIEQRHVQRGEAIKRPFKCGPEENREAWKKMVEEFFGADRVPDCPR